MTTVKSNDNRFRKPLGNPAEKHHFPWHRVAQRITSAVLVLAFLALARAPSVPAISTADAAGSNDYFENAPFISSPFDQQSDLTFATWQPDEPARCRLTRSQGGTAWYRITPSQNGAITFSTRGSNVDAVANVYRVVQGPAFGSQWTNLDPIGCATGGGLNAPQSFTWTGSTLETYYIQLGYVAWPSDPASKLVSLHVSSVGDPSARVIESGLKPVPRSAPPVVITTTCDIPGYRAVGGGVRFEMKPSSAAIRDVYVNASYPSQDLTSWVISVFNVQPAGGAEVSARGYAVCFRDSSNITRIESSVDVFRDVVASHEIAIGADQTLLSMGYMIPPYALYFLKGLIPSSDGSKLKAEYFFTNPGLPAGVSFPAKSIALTRPRALGIPRVVRGSITLSYGTSAAQDLSCGPQVPTSGLWSMPALPAIFWSSMYPTGGSSWSFSGAEWIPPIPPIQADLSVLCVDPPAPLPLPTVVPVPALPTSSPTPRLLLTPTPPSTPPSKTTFFGLGSTWRYKDDGSDQGVAWRSREFDDSSWRSGPGQLGYGDGDERTVISFGPDKTRKWPTTYFRKAFSVSTLPACRTLELRMIRDDSLVAYLNGVEILRDNMGSGVITSTTLASASVYGAAESVIVQATASAAALTVGQNVIAVEVHQDDRQSSDLSFDLELGCRT